MERVATRAVGFARRAGARRRGRWMPRGWPVCLGPVVLAWGIATSCVAVSSVAAAADQAEATLRFRASDEHVQSLTLMQLLEACGAREVEVDDPYHGRRMRYRAIGLRCVLDLGFANAGGAEGLRDRGLLLRALDGYTRPVAGRQLLEEGVFLAYGEPGLGDGDRAPRFSRIDRRQVDPAPFYMVWVGVEQGDPHAHPWPYQLATIEVAPFAEAFPRTVPTGLAEGDAGWRGYEIFQRACASCHSINGEGGRVGPELNVPRSIVEYRPIAQIKGYIRDPQATRYTSMPAHPGLGEADLDALIAYFRAMSRRKQDPRAGGDS